MKALAVTPGVRNSIRLQEVQAPEPGPSQALLKVVKIGIDRTDLDINDGLYGVAPLGSDYLIAGHECMATIEELPDGATGLSNGDLVVPTVRRPNGCFNCSAGESDMCLTGNYTEHGIKGLHGFASDYTVTDANFLVRVPSELEEVAVLLEPMSIAEKGIFQAFKIQERMLWSPKRALVLGAGPLGLLTIILLRLKGLEVHSVATRSADSLKAKLVQRLGATYVNSSEQPVEALGKFDLIFEETGVPSVANEASKLLTTNGVMCFLGIYPSYVASDDIGSFYTSVVLGNKTLFGSVNANRKYFEMGVSDLMKIEREFDGVVPSIVTARVSPEEHLRAYGPRRDDLKIVIEFSMR